MQSVFGLAVGKELLGLAKSAAGKIAAGINSAPEPRWLLFVMSGTAVTLHSVFVDLIKDWKLNREGCCCSANLCRGTFVTRPNGERVREAGGECTLNNVIERCEGVNLWKPLAFIGALLVSARVNMDSSPIKKVLGLFPSCLQSWLSEKEVAKVFWSACGLYGFKISNDYIGTVYGNDRYPRKRPMYPWNVLKMSFWTAAFAETFGAFGWAVSSGKSLPHQNAAGVPGKGPNVLYFVGDVGDGYIPTFAVASKLAQDRLTHVGAPWKCRVLFGGDMVYPFPSYPMFHERFTLPYYKAFQEAQDQAQAKKADGDVISEDVSESETAKQAKLEKNVDVAAKIASSKLQFYVLPGNHDHHDNCKVLHGAVSASRDNAWNECVKSCLFPPHLETEQPAAGYSYFEHCGFMIFSLDGAVSGDIDQDQRVYFENALKRNDLRNGIILAIHQPYWLVKGERPILNGLLVTLAKSGRLALVLAGDIHCFHKTDLVYYDDHAARRIPHIVCGGGGGFLHFPHLYPVVKNHLVFYEPDDATILTYPDPKQTFWEYITNFPKSLYNQINAFSCAALTVSLLLNTKTPANTFAKSMLLLCLSWGGLYAWHMPRSIAAHHFVKPSWHAQDLIASSICSENYKSIIRIKTQYSTHAEVVLLKLDNPSTPAWQERKIVETLRIIDGNAGDGLLPPYFLKDMKESPFIYVMIGSTPVLVPVANDDISLASMKADDCLQKLGIDDDLLATLTVRILIDRIQEMIDRNDPDSDAYNKVFQWYGDAIGPGSVCRIISTASMNAAIEAEIKGYSPAPEYDKYRVYISSCVDKDRWCPIATLCQRQ